MSSAESIVLSNSIVFNKFFHNFKWPEILRVVILVTGQTITILSHIH
jgi:hypothetical protein